MLICSGKSVLNNWIQISEISEEVYFFAFPIAKVVRTNIK